MVAQSLTATNQKAMNEAQSLWAGYYGAAEERVPYGVVDTDSWSLLQRA
jgi:hypothetical protein